MKTESLQTNVLWTKSKCLWLLKFVRLKSIISRLTFLYSVEWTCIPEAGLLFGWSKHRPLWKYFSLRVQTEVCWDLTLKLPFQLLLAPSYFFYNLMIEVKVANSRGRPNQNGSIRFVDLTSIVTLNGRHLRHLANTHWQFGKSSGLIYCLTHGILKPFHPSDNGGSGDGQCGHVHA